MITITEKAAGYIQGVLAKEKIECPPGGMRIGVKAGGCHGLQFIHKPEQKKGKNDHVVLVSEVRLIIDFKSLKYLQYTIIDHSDNLLDTPLTFESHLIKSKCGCGTSFELKDPSQ